MYGTLLVIGKYNEISNVVPQSSQDTRSQQMYTDKINGLGPIAPQQTVIAQ
jgi:hypothetical protein